MRRQEVSSVHEKRVDRLVGNISFEKDGMINPGHRSGRQKAWMGEDKGQEQS